MAKKKNASASNAAVGFKELEMKEKKNASSAAAAAEGFKEEVDYPPPEEVREIVHCPKKRKHETFVLKQKLKKQRRRNAHEKMIGGEKELPDFSKIRLAKK